MNTPLDPPSGRLRRSRVNGHVIAHRETGTGPAVLLLHGWPQTGAAWRTVVPLLKDHATVVVPDLPGFGASSRPHTGYDKMTVAATVHELMHTLGHDKYHAVGHDVGGQVLLPLARIAPDAIQSVVFVEAGVPGLGNSLASGNPFTGGSWHFGFNMLPDLPEALLTGREDVYLRWIFHRDSIGVVVADAVDDAFQEYVTAFRAPGGVRGAMEHYRALPTDIEDNRRIAAEGRSGAPALVVGARQGVGLGWLDSVEDSFATVTSAWIEDCGHYVPEERPAELADLLRAHWTRAEP
ncbi:alpha/beta hydrolase [Rhodococcus jostii]|uniref:Alpha/beta hydrolase n=1 Tax=Rhodococcus jostii TaxID=132919 RepID=A0ABU4CQJ7_RHOJO|nr:alpha/beta hydrolase [Rhodococcus jostii]MDV6285836.1 alpha/beta hydrolase [Rhodococcus jostii]